MNEIDDTNAINLGTALDTIKHFFAMAPWLDKDGKRLIETSEFKTADEMIRRLTLGTEEPARANRRREMDWQPIEAAPRDEEILVSDGESVCTASKSSDAWAEWKLSANGSTVWEGSGDRGGLVEVDFTPTHWMPLPTPPAIAMETGTAIDSEAGVVAKP